MCSSESKQPQNPRRFELFHALNSICSFKVRAVLQYHGHSYHSTVLNLATGENYHPDYVRMRLNGADLAGAPLVGVHTGTTSVAQAGVDPVAVPTLIDRSTGKIWVDSKEICIFLDSLANQEDSLYPHGERADIDLLIDIVDNFPNYQLLLDAPFRELTGCLPHQIIDTTRVERKMELCEEYLQGPDVDLQYAYSAKLQREASVLGSLVTPAAMLQAYQLVGTALDYLERRLGDGRQSLVANQFSLADLFWGVQLLHLRSLSLDDLWLGTNRVSVAKFLKRVEGTPVFRSVMVGP